jgi:serine/threonine protein phosphatase 1
MVSVQSRGATTNGALVYAIGDIHGCYDLMKSLLAKIAADYVVCARGRRPMLIFCGDYVDRGPQSARVLDALVWLHGRSEVDLHLLKGNHEEALLAFLDDPEKAAPWLSFGGAETLLSYGVMPPSDDGDEEGLARARDELLDRMPAVHLRLLQRLELMVEVGDYAFVHAGIRPGTPLAEQDEQDLLWIRRGFVDHPGPFEKVIVHGHVWVSDKPQISQHRIGLDSGAYTTGALTAVRLDEGTVTVLQARSRPAVEAPPAPEAALPA